MKKESRGTIFLWAFIAIVVAGGTFLLAEHLGVGSAPGAASSGGAPAGQPPAAPSAEPGAVAMQQFSNDGYSFSVPEDWKIERTGADTIALHPASSSSDAACKIEMSAFPYASDDDISDWIAHRIGADPSLTIVEQSSEDVAIDGGTGIRWTGTIDDIPTTLVYAFSDAHAYEIAPSVIGEGADGSAQCDDMLQTFLSAFTI